MWWRKTDDTHAAEVLRNRALVALLLNTDLRISEAVALTHADVAINARSGRVIVRQGKGNQYREVPLNAEARAALRAYLDVSGKDGTPT